MMFSKKKSVILLDREGLIIGAKQGKKVQIKEFPLSKESINLTPFSASIEKEEISKTLRRNAGLLGGYITLLIPESSFLINFVTLQEVPDSTLERKRMVAFYMGKRYQGKGNIELAAHYLGKGKFVVSVIGADVLNHLQEVFRENKIKIRSVKPASISSLNYFLFKKQEKNYNLILNLRDMLVFMAGREGELMVYRRLRPPFTEEEVFFELDNIDEYLGVKTKKFSCGKQIEGIEDLQIPCYRMAILGEFL